MSPKSDAVLLALKVYSEYNKGMTERGFGQTIAGPAPLRTAESDPLSAPIHQFHLVGELERKIMRHLRSAIFLVISTMLFPVASLEAASPPTALEVAGKSVMLLITPYSMGTGTYLGGGVWVSAHHCVDDLEKGEEFLMYNPDTGRSHLCKVWKSNAASDVTLIVSATKHVIPKGVKLAQRDVMVGEKVTNIGFGEGLHKDPMVVERRYYGGKVTSFTGRVGYDKNFWYCHESAAISGDSGGPSLIVIDGEAYIIGTLWGSNSYSDISVCSHLSELRELIRR